MSIPSELQFENVGEMAVINSKRSLQITPSNGTSVTVNPNQSGNYSNFVIPVSDDSVDLSSIYILFDFVINFLGAAYATTQFVSIENGIESAIDRMEWWVGSQEGERIDSYHLIQSALERYGVSQAYVDSFGGACDLVGLSWRTKNGLLAGGLANSAAQSNTIQCCVPLKLSGLANVNSLFPAYLAQGQPLNLRIYWKNASAVVKRFNVTTNNIANIAGIADTYTLSNIRLNYEAVSTSESYKTSIMNYVSAGNMLQWPITTFYNELLSLPSGTVNFSRSITANFSNVQAVYLAFFADADFNSYSAWGEDRTRVPPTLQYARLLVNGVPEPANPIDCANGAAEAFQYLLKAMKTNKNADVISPFSLGRQVLRLPSTTVLEISDSMGVAYGRELNDTLLSRFGTDPADTDNANPFKTVESPSFFVLGIPLAKSQYTSGVNSGMDLSVNSGQITINLQFSSATAVNYTVLAMVQHQRTLSLGLGNASVTL